jgi:hypothetical protein
MKWLLGGVLLLADGNAVTDAVPLVRWLSECSAPQVSPSGCGRAKRFAKEHRPVGSNARRDAR